MSSDPFRVWVLVVALAMSACAGEGAEHVLRLGHDQTVGHPYHLAAERFANRTAEATGGAVRIQVFPAAQLGDSPEQIEGLRLGTLDVALAAFSHVSQFCPEFGLFGAPFLFEDEAHFATVFDEEIGELLDEACRERYSVRLLATLTSGYRVLFNGRRPVTEASDLEGLTIRVMGGEADALTWQVFGALPVPMPYSEVYSALQAGVIDGAENEPISILSNKFYEAAPYFAPTNHLVLPMGLFISQQGLEGLPEEYRPILREEAREAAVWQRDFMREQNARALAEMQERHGVQVSSIGQGELLERSTAIQDEVAENLDLRDLLEMVRTAAH
ncbi:MAG: TRAP transporter substrate-binding protein [Gemmatimonadetes bacterium]|nr:TRAP transporter substrate-binding protein [Gemmatimonadota bacterium]